MKCPSCGASNIRTYVTRQLDAESVLRFRRCSICAHRWLTRELEVQNVINWQTFPPTVVLEP